MADKILEKITDGSGDNYIVRDADAVHTVDSVLSTTSTNPLQNKVVTESLNEKASKVASSTAGNFAGLTSSGDLTDSGYAFSSFATAAQGIAAETALQPEDIAIVQLAGNELYSISHDRYLEIEELVTTKRVCMLRTYSTTSYIYYYDVLYSGSGGISFSNGHGKLIIGPLDATTGVHPISNEPNPNVHTYSYSTSDTTLFDKVTADMNNGYAPFILYNTTRGNQSYYPMGIVPNSRTIVFGQTNVSISGTGLSSYSLQCTFFVVASNGCSEIQYFSLPSLNDVSEKVNRDGDTMTGVLNTMQNQYTDSYDSGAINMRNSNITKLNALYTADLADSASEGIHFYRDSTHTDSIWVNNGTMYFVPNRALGTNTTAANSERIPHIPAGDARLVTFSTTGIGTRLSGHEFLGTSGVSLGAVSSNPGASTVKGYSILNYYNDGSIDINITTLEIQRPYLVGYGKSSSVLSKKRLRLYNDTGNIVTVYDSATKSTTVADKNAFTIMSYSATSANKSILIVLARTSTYSVTVIRGGYDSADWSNY